jgi:hypothetical protein
MNIKIDKVPVLAREVYELLSLMLGLEDVPQEIRAHIVAAQREIIDVLEDSVR